MARRPSGGAIALAALAVIALASFAYFALVPVGLPRVPFEFSVESGMNLKAIARRLVAEGALAEGETFWMLGRLLGRDRSIQAGVYRFEHPPTRLELLDKLARGDVVVLEMAFVEGSTFKQWLAQLSAEPRIRHTLTGRGEPGVREALGIAESSAEGWLFPDTYRFPPGSGDLEVLRRSHATMKKVLAEAWAARDDTLAVATPYEALILASIVEKETARAEERPLVAAVFHNRLKRGMRLQADPTVIYGMGENYAGTIRKKDLMTDTPWNTYTRDGLPPTPIAMPGAAALQAATHPARSDVLYFVARGDGSHEFSRTLDEHNRAVARYQLGK